MSAKTKKLGDIRDCLRASPVAESLPDGWEDLLLGKHLAHPERDIQETTIIAIEFGFKPGWVSLRQEGGGFRMVLWAPRLHINPAARSDTAELKRCLDSILPAHLVQIRSAEPPSELLRKLESSSNGAGARR